MVYYGVKYTKTTPCPEKLIVYAWMGGGAIERGEGNETKAIKDECQKRQLNLLKLLA